MITDPLFYAVAIPAVLLAAISKGGFGGGLAMLGVPLLSLVIPAPKAAAIMLPILCLMDVMGVWAYRKTWHRRNLRIMASGAVIGIAIGTFTFHWFSDGSIRLLVGCIAVVFSLDYWFRKKPAGVIANPDVGRGMLWGALSGFTSFLAHAGGPPANTYLLPQRMDKTLFVGHGHAVTASTTPSSALLVAGPAAGQQSDDVADPSPLGSARRGTGHLAAPAHLADLVLSAMLFVPVCHRPQAFLRWRESHTRVRMPASANDDPPKWSRAKETLSDEV